MDILNKMMSGDKITLTQKWSIFTILIFIFFASFDINRPPVDLHQFRQTQTLSTIYNYFINGINLLRPEIDTNGSNSVVILEFPLYQSLVASLMRIFGYNEIVGRFVNIFATIITGIMLARMSDRYIKSNSFLFVLIFFLLSPSVIFWGSTLLIDPLALMISVASIYFLCEWVHRSHLADLMKALCIGILAVSTKLTAAFIPFAAFFGVSCLVVRKDRLNNTKIILGVLFFFGVCALSFLAWNSYSRSMHAINPHPYTNSSVDWYFGTMEQRMSLMIWGDLFNRLINNNFIFISLFGLVTLISCCKPKSNYKPIIVSVIVITCSILYLFIFINLNYIHTYYQIPLNGANAFVGGIGAAFLFSRLVNNNNATKHVLFGFLITALSFASHKVLKNSWIDLSPIHSPYAKSTCEYEIGNQIKVYLQKKNINTNLIGVIFEKIDECWNGPHALMYYLKQRGYIVDNAKDPLLSKEQLDLIIAIYRDQRLPKLEGWTLMSTASLNGSVSGFQFAIFQKTPAIIGSKSVSTSSLINGNEENLFNTQISLHDLYIPPYTVVSVRFLARWIGSEHNNPGYFILRTYSGGYSYDQARKIYFQEDHDLKEFSFYLETDRWSDYVIEFGQIKSGAWEIDGPVTISYKTKFLSENENVTKM